MFTALERAPRVRGDQLALSGIRHPVSGIKYLASSIKYPVVCAILCIALFCSPGILAQENETPVDESRGAEYKEEEGKYEVEQRQIRRSQQAEQPRQRPGGLPPELLKIMKEENISQEDLRNNPEIRRKVFQKVAAQRRESSKGSQPDGDRVQESQRGPTETPAYAGDEDSQPGTDGEEPSQRRRAGSRDRVVDEGLRPYMSIIENNLFRLLGSGGEERRSSYALTAVISSNPEEADLGSSDTGENKENTNKAIIEEIGGEKSYYVAEGDIFGDEIEVVDIDDQVVSLDRSGKEERLRLGENTSSGRSGGRGQRGAGRFGGGESGPSGGNEGERAEFRRSGGNFDASRLPPFAQEIMRQRGISMEQLRNNPELQQRLRSEIQNRMRGLSQGRQGGRQPQPMRLQGGRTGGRDRRR